MSENSPTKSGPNPLYISTDEELEHFCTLLKEEEVICLDTEFMREKTYYPNLCLIQIASDKDIALVDPLAESMNLEPLWQIIEDPSKRKVFHSCRQDLEIFFYTRGHLPENVFDTQIASMLCGLGDNMSLESLVQLVCNVTMDKTQRRSDWSKRPLNGAQLDYAALDVRYLPKIYKKLFNHLEKNRRLEWLAEETKPLLDPNLYAPNVQKLYQKLNLDTRNKSVQDAAMKLVKARENLAQKLNVPRNRVIDDPTIRIISKRDLNDQKIWHDFIGEQSHETTNLLIEAFENLSVGEQEIPPAKRSGRIPDMIFQALTLLMLMTAETYAISPALIASKSDMTALYQDREKADTPLLKGWRYEVFGAQALDFLNGKAHITVHGDKVVVGK